MANRSISEDDVALAAKLARVPPELALAVWQQESSSGRNAGVSPKGARGGFQLMPATFKEVMPSGSIDDPVDNMEAGLKYLRKGLDASGGDMEGAAQFYYHGSVLSPGIEGPNSGPGTPSTRGYGKSVVAKAKDIASRRNGFQSLAVAPSNQTSTAPDNSVFASLFGMDTGDDGGDEEGDETAPDDEAIEGDYEVDTGDVPDMPGLTQPLNPIAYGGMNDMAANQAGMQDYDFDSLIRSLVDQELKT